MVSVDGIGVRPGDGDARRHVPAKGVVRAPPGAWQLLAGIMDPEVPVISIVELGIVRDVREVGTEVEVTITPTYSGCPAMDAIAEDIGAAFAREGLAARVVTALSPAWTTDWMEHEATARLAAYGIAPPGAAAAPARIDVTGISPLRRARTPVACPRCGSRTTTLLAQFGSTACKALYRCDACREPFDHFKPH
ncbi:MAG: 1,2-phenylacetyl-CoA epoxidase subunit PaaD [Burkholderiales bacterium]